MRIQSRQLSREAVNSDAAASFALREFRLPRFPFVWHYHLELELTLIRRGRGQRFVGDSVQDFAVGDCCLLGAELPHTWHSEARRGAAVESAVIQFRPDLFGDRLTALPELRPLAALLVRARRGLVIGGRTRAAVAAGIDQLCGLPPSSPRRFSGLLDLLARIADSREVAPLASTSDTPAPDAESRRRLDAVFAYLDGSRGEDVSQRTAARLARLSPAAFSRFFRRAMGRTFVDHLNDRRISQACRALLESDDDIATIAFAAGYNNLSNFNRCFRRLKGMSPREYRRLTQRE